MIKEDRTIVELNDEELMGLVGGEYAKNLVSPIRIVYPMYGIKPPIQVMPLYGVIVRDRI